MRFEIVCKWRSQCISLDLSAHEYETATLRTLKLLLQETLSIPCDKQRFLGIRSSSGTLNDDTPLTVCEWPRQGFILMGTPLDDTAHSTTVEAEVTADYNSIEAQKRAVKLMADPINQERIKQAVDSLEINWLRSPRPGKKLLVLDIDFTIYDPGANPGTSPDRPYLLEFLGTVYEYFDFVFWSQTGWSWVEIKLTSLGLLHRSDFGPCFALNKTSMIPLHSAASSRSPKEPVVKVLQIIWSKCNQLWGAQNSIQVDDKKANHLTQPQNGILIQPYTVEARQSDKELLLLGTYLAAVGKLEDVRAVDHSRWKAISKAYQQEVNAHGLCDLLSLKNMLA